MKIPQIFLHKYVISEDLKALLCNMDVYWHPRKTSVLFDMLIVDKGTIACFDVVSRFACTIVLGGGKEAGLSITI